MVELRLHLELYSPGAVDEAIRTFEPHATIEQLDAAPYRLLRVRAASAALERRVAGELGNFALGLTMSSRASAADRATADDAATTGGAP